MLQDKYPYVAIQGEYYPPPLWRQYSSQALGILKLIIIVCVVSGINVFPALGIQTPGAWEWITNNKIYGCLMLFFVCNAIEGQLVSTGAFEVHFNDVPIWSKIEVGRIPQPPELLQIIENQIRMDSSPSWSDAL